MCEKNLEIDRNHIAPRANINVRGCNYVRPQVIQDGNDGCLSILTKGMEVMFVIKRVYFINGFLEKKSIRGNHAHKTLDQVMFCVSGNFTLSLDDGKQLQSLDLSVGDDGVFIGRGVWHTMDTFSPDCVILVLANAPYTEGDYIRNYNEFKNYTDNSTIL